MTQQGNNGYYQAQDTEADLPFTMGEDDGVLDWGSEISEESSFILLDEGDYQFTVTNLEKERYDGGAKIPACPMARLTISIQDKKTGTEVELREQLLLHKKMEWKISEFFICIGQKEEGKPLTPNWDKVIGSTGSAEIELNSYVNKNGENRTNNRVKRWLAPQKPQQQPTQAQQQQPQQQQQSFAPPATPHNVSW